MLIENNNRSFQRTLRVQVPVFFYSSQLTSRLSSPKHSDSRTPEMYFALHTSPRHMKLKTQQGLGKEKNIFVGGEEKTVSHRVWQQHGNVMKLLRGAFPFFPDERKCFFGGITSKGDEENDLATAQIEDSKVERSWKWNSAFKVGR